MEFNNQYPIIYDKKNILPQRFYPPHPKHPQDPSEKVLYQYIS